MVLSWVITDPSSIVRTSINTLLGSLQNAREHQKRAEEIYDSVSNYLDRATINSIKTCLDSILHSIKVIENNLAYCQSVLGEIGLFDSIALESKTKQSIDEERNAASELHSIENYALNIRLSIFSQIKNFFIGIMLNLKRLIIQFNEWVLQTLCQIKDFIKSVYDWFNQSTVRYFIYTGIGCAVFTILLLLFLNYMKRFQFPFWIIP